MAIHVICPACQAHLKVRDEHAGRQGKCPRCDAPLRVPAQAAGSAVIPPPPPATHVASHREAQEPAPATPIPPPIPASHLPEDAPTVVDSSIGPLLRAASAPVVDVDLDAPVRRPPRRPRSAKSPRLLWMVAGGMMLLPAAAGGLFFAIRSTGMLASIAAGAGADAPQAAQTASFNPAPFNPKYDLEPVDTSRPLAGASLEDVVEFVKHGIVKIETSDGLNNRRGLGSGFVIDPSGLVATNYHVMSDAAKADVIFNDGTRFGVDGYMAVDRRSDLAIFRLNGVPPNVKALALNYGDGPRDAAQVYAIGHPLDNEFTTTGGIVGRVLRTTQLPGETRRWLESTLEESDDDLWIQHDAKIAPGNSGGPLINARGEVVGVNSWVNQKLGLGYAIHARHLHELARHQETAAVPLKTWRRSEPEPTHPQLAALPMTSERIKRLCDEMASKNWRPSRDDDWLALDELAQTITAAKYVQSHPGTLGPMPLDQQQAVIREADRAVAELRAVRWRDDDQMRPINAHAGKDRPPYGGAFVFGRVKKVLQQGDQEAALLIELIGSDEQYYLSLDDSITGLAEGDCVLVLGISHPKTVTLGDDKQKPTNVRVLLSKVVLPLSKL